MLLFFVVISLVYSTSSQFVLSAYSFASIWVFVVSAWLAYGFVDVEHVTQQQVTVLHMGTLRRYLCARLCFLILMALVVACFAYVYPLIIHRFSVPVPIADLLVAIVEHIALALLGVGVGIMFNERFVSRKGSAIIGLAVAILLSIVGQQIATQLSPFLRFIAFVLPPVSHTVYVVGQWGSFGTFDRFVSLLWPFIYSAILMASYVNRLEKKQFD